MVLGKNTNGQLGLGSPFLYKPQEIKGLQDVGIFPQVDHIVWPGVKMERHMVGGNNKGQRHGNKKKFKPEEISIEVTTCE